MKQSLRITLFITFISSGIGFWFISECIGIGCLILAGVWGILFVFNKSPIRKWCWSVSDIISIEIINYAGFPPQGNKKYLTVYNKLRASSPIKVDKVLLSMGRRKIIPLDWKSSKVSGDESEGYISFKRPERLRSGKHSARLIAYTPYGYSKSEVFTIEVRD